METSIIGDQVNNQSQPIKGDIMKLTVSVVDSDGRVVAKIHGCKTLRGARGKIKKSSIAMHSDWAIRIEEKIEIIEGEQMGKENLPPCSDIEILTKKKTLTIIVKKMIVFHSPAYELRTTAGDQVADEGWLYDTSREAHAALRAMYPATSVWHGRRTSRGYKIDID